ncbi:hypothetical protein ALC53_12409 [Atta colombica]|uniref:Uncharacterized protein n=1 Tax=Atta colombica TaxID=520822 RepID=A0A195AYS5_9HYME|nr:hypothetical protein ALC53_12409 [Atta colombica]
MSTLAGRCLETISQSREKETNLERTTAVSVEGTEERSRRRMEEGGGERERVTDTSSSRVESFYRSSAQPTWGPRRSTKKDNDYDDDEWQCNNVPITVPSCLTDGD